MRAAILAVVFTAALGCEPESPVPQALVTPASPVAHRASVPRATRGWVGVTIPLRAVDVAPAFAARVERVHVRAGDVVAAGEPIATLDARALGDELVAAGAEIASAQAALVQAAVDVEETRHKLGVDTRLAAESLVSNAQREDTAFAHQRAVAAAKRAHAALREKVVRRDQLRSRRADAVVRAPFAGSIAQVQRGEGAAAGPDAPIVRLISEGAPWVRFAVPAAEAAALSEEAPLRVTLEAPPITLAARVRSVAPELDPASQLIFVEAELEPSSGVRSGVAAWVVAEPEPSPRAR